MTQRILKFLHNFISTNRLLKVISLALAFVVWLVVVNVSNPEMKSSVTSSITIENGHTLTEKDKYYNLDTQNARVSFSVRTNQRNDVRPSDFDVYVDMRDLSITGALPVYVTAHDSIKDIVSDITVNPVVVHATTEDIQDKSFDLTIRTIGTPADGYAVGPATYSPSRVKLQGPASEVGKISRVGFEVNIDGSEDSVWGSAEFIYYDANDNPITPDVSIKVKNTASYFVPVYKKKTVSITVQTSGDPAAGYMLDSVNCEPNFIEIYGEDSVLKNISAIILPTNLLNISGATADVTSSIDIENYLPENVYTDTVTNIALAARISKTSLTPPMMNTPDGPRENAAAPGAESGTHAPAPSEAASAASGERAEGSASSESASEDAASAASESESSGSQASDSAHAGSDAASEQAGNAADGEGSQESSGNEGTAEGPAADGNNAGTASSPHNAAAEGTEHGNTSEHSGAASEQSGNAGPSGGEHETVKDQDRTSGTDYVVVGSGSGSTGPTAKNGEGTQQ